MHKAFDLMIKECNVDNLSQKPDEARTRRNVRREERQDAVEHNIVVSQVHIRQSRSSTQEAPSFPADILLGLLLLIWEGARQTVAAMLGASYPRL
ncbi:hypothetical protein DPV78_010374 [Talaromyces pinophilus]|nr:hypothetical protein DPV78_010374 [Talaromyces pinophilus]